MRIMGLDYGSRTVGVALTDPTGLIAQPHCTLTRDRETKLRKTLQEIESIVAEYRVERIVLGLPFNMDDSEENGRRKPGFSGRSWHSGFPCPSNLWMNV